MSADYGLTDNDRTDIHARLTSWFGDARQAFLVSHLAPVVDRIKADAYIAGMAAGVEVRAEEFQAIALEMARKADQAERRAEEAEAEVERLRSAADKVGHQAVCPVDPCDCWMRDLAPLLDDNSDEALCLCGEPVGHPDHCGSCCGCGVASEHEHMATVEHLRRCPICDTRFTRDEVCDHHWLDRPESDTRECPICGTEVAG